MGNAFNLGSISVPLESISVADQLTLSIRFTGTQYQNSWNVWVYPQEVPEVGKEIFYTRSFADAEKALSQGKKVLLNPEKSRRRSVCGERAGTGLSGDFRLDVYCGSRKLFGGPFDR